MRDAVLFNELLELNLDFNCTKGLQKKHSHTGII